MRLINARLTCAVLVIFGLVVGTLTDSVSEPSAVERGGYLVVAADFHVHSFFGDGLVSPLNLVLEARRQGLGAFAITNHSGLFAARLGRWFSRRIGGPVVLVGQEITAPEYHMIAAGIERQVGWRLAAADAADLVHAQRGVTIAAHPTPEWSGFDAQALTKLDGTEVMHPSVFGGRGAELRDFYRRAEAAGGSPAAIGSSDYHGFQRSGAFRTYVFVREVSERGVLEALRDQRTVVFGLDGEAFGNPEMIALLNAEALEPGDLTAGHAAASAVDGVARAGGWLGLLGLVLFSPRIRERRQSV